MKEKKLYTYEILFTAAMAVILSSLIIESSVIPYMLGSGFDMFLKMIRYFAYALLVAETVLYKQFTKKELLYLIGIGAVAVLNAYFASFSIPLRFLLVIGCIGLSPNKVLKQELYIVAFWFFVIVIGARAGIIENWGFGLESARPRYCLGFIYPSHTTSLYLALVLLYGYVRKEKMTIWEVLILTAIDLWQYTYTDSRSGTALVILALAAVWLLRYPRIRKLTEFLPLQYTFLTCAFATVLFTILYIYFPGELQGLNKALSSRLSLQSKAMLDYGVTLFGQHINWIGNGGSGYTQSTGGAGYNYVDSSYIKLLLDQGLVVWLLVISGFCGLSKYAKKAKDNYMIIVLAVLAIYCIVEQWIIDPAYDPLFVLLWIPLFKNHIITEENTE